MKKHLRFSVTFAITFISFHMFAPAPVSAADSITSNALKDRLHKIVTNSGFKSSEIGLWVGTRENDDLKTVFSDNGDRLMIPASLSKLITLGAVLHQLEPSFKYTTLLVSDAKIENGVLRGPLYLKGGGDPSFVSENMWFLVNELTRAGVTTVDGPVIVDDSRFDQIRFGDDRQEERVDRAYDAPLGAMSFNWNSVAVYVRPGDKKGDPLKVFADVQSPYIKVKNESHTSGSGNGKNIVVERTTEKGFNGDVVIVRGGMALDQEEAVVYKNISQPDLWAGTSLVEFLKQRGITVKGEVKTGAAPASARVLAKEESKPLSQVVTDMAKWSNNYVAEMVTKTLAAESGEKPATMATGLVRIRKYFESAGFKTGEYEFVNAAGFTRKNKLSPSQIGKYLEHVRADFTFFPEYLSALPIAGVDGTLRKRMKDTAAERWVRAKTGLLNGVVGLSGFAGQSDGKIYTFAFIYNGGGKEDKARALFDHLAAQIVAK